MPASEEAEQHVLACCLLDGSETIARAIGAGVTGECFYWPANRLLWQLMTEMWAAKPPVTLETLAEELQTRRQLEGVGGFPYLIQITGKIPTTAHVGYFIEKLKEKNQLREIIKVCTGAVEQAYAFTGGLEEFVGGLSQDFNRAIGLGAVAEEKIQVVAGRLAAETAAFAETGKLAKRETVPWGLVDLDKVCLPMEAGELVVLGGRPSTGKSALADQVAWRTAERGGNVLMFTYEMTKRDKAVRIAQQMTGCNYNDLSTLPRDRVGQFTEAFGVIRDCPGFHVFERDVAVARLVARCRTFAARQPLNLVVVDFLQYLARLEPMVGKERTDEKIGRITAALKDIARECNCPVLMLASLNREGEKDGRPPRMSDLRASGEIESDADVIALLHWPKTSPSGAAQDPHDNLQDNFYVEFNQEKGRNKGVHQVGLHFARKATRFNNYMP